MNKSLAKEVEHMTALKDKNQHYVGPSMLMRTRTLTIYEVSEWSTRSICPHCEHVYEEHRLHKIGVYCPTCNKKGSVLPPYLDVKFRQARVTDYKTGLFNRIASIFSKDAIKENIIVEQVLRPENHKSGPEIIVNVCRQYFATDQDITLVKTSDGKFHSDEGPAIIWEDGTYAYFHEGKLHREDGPAFESRSGVIMWYKHGKIHRLGGPAVTYQDAEEFYIDGRNFDEMVTS